MTHSIFSTARILLTALLLAAPALAPAWELAGDKTLIAHTRDQQRLTLGTVSFEPRGAGLIAFTLKPDSARFTDYFLSMKEFKCLDGQVEVVCHVPYPYPQQGTVSVTAGKADFAWLEHSLLFIYKLPTEFSAKLWNGLYYKMALTDQGLVGSPQAIDLNRISAPPDNPSVPPYKPAYRDDIAPGARWIEKLTIE